MSISLAAVSMLTVLLFQFSKTTCKQIGEFSLFKLTEKCMDKWDAYTVVSFLSKDFLFLCLWSPASVNRLQSSDPTGPQWNPSELRGNGCRNLLLVLGHTDCSGLQKKKVVPIGFQNQPFCPRSK